MLNCRTLLVGFLGAMAINVLATIRYVDANGTNATPPYTNWGTAATSIQDAVDASSGGDQILVTNGTYQTGQRVINGTNRVVLDRPIMLRSVNGAADTVIDGANQARCVYMAEGGALAGFTLSNGFAGALFPSGGGLYSESTNVAVSNCVFVSNQGSLGGAVYAATLYNCTLSNNFAGLEGGAAESATLNNCTLTANLSNNYGGAASHSALNNCTLMGNYASFDGGGADFCTLNNCTLTGNSAGRAGGGAINSALNNCIAFYNTGPWPNYYGGSLSYCCTTPLPGGPGNITSPPIFVDEAGRDLQLQSNSPCINAGKNAYAPAGADLDGNPRIVGGTVDIGAFEFQTPTSILSYAWLQRYGLPADGTADYADSDGDGMNNWQEWRAGTDPTDPLSVLRMLTPMGVAANVTVSWQSVSGVTYFLDFSTNLQAQPAFLPLATGIAGQPGVTSYVDTNAFGRGPFFYRVGVQ